MPPRHAPVHAEPNATNAYLLVFFHPKGSPAAQWEPLMTAFAHVLRDAGPQQTRGGRGGRGGASDLTHWMVLEAPSACSAAELAADVAALVDRLAGRPPELVLRRDVRVVVLPMSAADYAAFSESSACSELGRPASDRWDMPDADRLLLALWTASGEQ